LLNWAAKAAADRRGLMLGRFKLLHLSNYGQGRGTMPKNHRLAASFEVMHLRRVSGAFA
jgi:hypothetical protein